MDPARCFPRQRLRIPIIDCLSINRLRTCSWYSPRQKHLKFATSFSQAGRNRIGVGGGIGAAGARRRLGVPARARKDLIAGSFTKSLNGESDKLARAMSACRVMPQPGAEKARPQEFGVGHVLRNRNVAAASCSGLGGRPGGLPSAATP